MSDLDPRSALAATIFPKEWAKIATTPGKSKARQKLRQRAEAAVKMRDLRSQGRSCASCASFCREGPATSGIGSHCEMDSDFYGYALTKATDLCTRWHAQS